MKGCSCERNNNKNDLYLCLLLAMISILSLTVDVQQRNTCNDME